MTTRVVAVRWLLVTFYVPLWACAGSHVPPVPPESPFFGGSLTSHDASLRHYMTLRDSSALRPLLESGPKDELIKQLNAGLFLRRLGRFGESNVALQEAERLAQERYTKSISQNVAAFLVSDRVLDFYPSALEWSMIYYYGMMNYLELGDVENALVEARKANALLRRYSNANPGRSFTNPAAVQYVAGLLQWSAGDENDAIVSLRQALAGFEEYDASYGVPPPRPVAEDVVWIASELGLDEVAERTRLTYLPEQAETQRTYVAGGKETGELLVVIENGFVAHRSEQKLYIPVLAEEKDSVVSGSAGSAIRAALRVLIRTIVVMNELSREGVDYPTHEGGVIIATAGSAVGLDLISLAWPSYQLSGHRAGSVRVSVDNQRWIVPTLLQDLSAIAARDFEEQKPTIMLRMVARGLLKEAAVAAAEEAGEEAGGNVGGFVGRVAARALASATERADTRSWSALPAELFLVRFRLPAGQHELLIRHIGLNNRPELIKLDVEIEAGHVTTQTVVLVGHAEGDRARFRAAARGVRYEVPELSQSEIEEP